MCYSGVPVVFQWYNSCIIVCATLAAGSRVSRCSSKAAEKGTT
jgi:hypothetical protein